ncbi:MAG: hypothetical protein J6U54_00105 [Clostridiales bacterium]|nr:hypothetical protein [Clostridiales bacterium]
MEKKVERVSRVAVTGGKAAKKEATISYVDLLVGLGVSKSVATAIAHGEVCRWVQAKDNGKIAISEVKKSLSEGKLKPSMFADKEMLKKIQSL